MMQNDEKNSGEFIKNVKYYSERIETLLGVKNRPVFYGLLSVFGITIISAFPIFALQIIAAVIGFFIIKKLLSYLYESFNEEGKDWFSFDGRINRLQYWNIIIKINLITFAFIVASFGVALLFIAPFVPFLAAFYWILFGIFMLVWNVWAFAATFVKRCRDIGITPTVLWWLLIPTGVTQLLATFILGILPSSDTVTSEPN